MESLLNAAERSQEEVVRRESLAAVVTLKDHMPDYVNVLIGAFERESDLELKRDIAYWLGESRETRAVDPLLGQLSARGMPGSWRMVEALAKIGDTREIARIRAAVDDDPELLPHRGAFPEERNLGETFLGLE